jgi:hypothetical protein
MAQHWISKYTSRHCNQNYDKNGLQGEEPRAIKMAQVKKEEENKEKE